MHHPKHDWQQVGTRLRVTVVMDDWLGPTLALIRCECGQYGLAHLVAWRGAQLTDRIFAVRNVESRVVETYLANISRDYCDLSRKQAETSALLQASDELATLLQVNTKDMIVKSVSTATCNPGFREWREISETDFPLWQEKIPEADEIK